MLMARRSVRKVGILAVFLVVTGTTMSPVFARVDRDLTFGNIETFDVEMEAENIARGDVTGDGLKDIILSGDTLGHPNEPDLFYFENSPDGYVGAPVQAPPYSGPDTYTTDEIDVGDLNGDGLEDVATTSGVGVVVYLQAAGTLMAPTLLPTNSDVCALDIHDVDDDDVDEMVVGTAQDGVLIFEHGTDGFEHVFATRNYVPVLQVGDINGDTLPDIVGVGEGAVHVYLQTEQETFFYAYVRRVSGKNGQGGPASLEVADVTGDEREDIVVSVGSQDKCRIHVISPDKNGTLRPPDLLFVPMRRRDDRGGLKW